MAIIGPVQWYQPSERLSEDVLGTLWMGRDRRSGSTVTIRLLDERLTSDPRAVHRATDQLRWAQWEAGNRHLARVLDLRLGLAGQPAFVVSEGSSGGTVMQHLMRGQAFTVRRAIEVVAAVADGLASAHASWVYHGALTPASILLDDDVVAKVTDIGLQELLNGPDDHGPSVRASSLNDRAATDVLAVARLFDQMLSKPGREAGVGSDLSRAWESEISAELGDLIRRALSPHRLQRPAMAELAAALSPALQAPDVPRRIRPAERAHAERVEPVPSTQAPRPEPAGRPRADAPILLSLPQVPTVDLPPPPPQGPGPEPVEASSDEGIGGEVTRQAPSEPIAGSPSVAPVEEPAERATEVGRAPRAHRPRLRFALGVCLVLGVLVGGIFAFRAMDSEVRPQGPATVTATPTTSVTPSLQPATVPVLIGQSVETATELLEQDGLLVGNVTAVPGETGLVVRTEPTQGEAVMAGTAVDLFVGNGGEE
jgi:hypothetical protein